MVPPPVLGLTKIGAFLANTKLSYAVVIVRCALGLPISTPVGALVFLMFRKQCTGKLSKFKGHHVS